MTTTPPSSGGRAGRNLPVATAVGIGLLVLIWFALFVFRPLFVGIAMTASVLAVRELSIALLRHERTVVRIVAYPAAVVMPLVAYGFGGEAALVAFAVAVVAAAGIRLRDGNARYFDDFASTVLVLAYVPLLIGFATAMSKGANGAERVIAFILLTVGNDTGGYIAGVLFGKHPMAPSISPKKSWEGFVGSLLAQALLGGLVVPLLLPIAAWQGIALGLVMAVTATVGDFAESAIKRDLGVKDMSHAIPGHGGFMDRLDSLLVNALIAWIAFTLMGV